MSYFSPSNPAALYLKSDTAAVDKYWDQSEHHPEEGASTPLGFWVYLMSDCLMFAVLFAVYGVLGTSYAAGPGPKALFDLNLVALNTAMLLLSSITFGFAMLALYAGDKKRTLRWLFITLLFGLAFLAIELYEFWHLIHEGAVPQRSAFLSSFFALVGTHGLHVFFGSVWLVTLMVQLSTKGITGPNIRRMNCLSMFWHFLDVIWIGVFTFVYLLGMI
ncbi:cytochrome o ubiquinol oxidase subunit III [Xinfangfangia sp. D13-10-4-6]|uniref:cytochrome o ubiquinol oxidase subunit III n=1 Tax=Pseudogemmobacter hezensis TaxID=2737662 RepID=UPI001555D4CE|nr:cytochrome o ubiquinol oxidase subunit III [Pseudogemmobacter hezensis]NPD16029.1 cytochrome o ubiquinol oxidase subunit III [Pseudogemmobacter hezensis]